MGTNRYAFERYLNVRTARDPSFSPDGRRLSFITDITGVAEVWTVPVTPASAAPSWPHQITFRGERSDSATYAPAAPVLLVAGDAGGAERTQLYLVSDDGVTFTPLTDQPDVIHTFGSWSPDGNHLCYASNRRDARYFDLYEQTLDGTPPRLIYQDDSTNGALHYAPDGRRLLFSRVESNTRNALFLLDLNSGTAQRLTPETTDGPAHHLAPQWAADGSGCYLLSNRGREFLSLAWLDVTSGEMTYLTDDQWDDEEVALSRDGTRLALLTNVEGYSRLALFDISRGWSERQPLLVPELPAGVMHEVTWSRDGARLAFTYEAADTNADVWVWGADERVLWQATQSAMGGIPREHFVVPELVHYPTFDGRQIPAFLFAPAGQERHTLPVVVYVHGGPESQLRPAFNPILQYLVGAGYAVLAPNVRGSTGYGFTYQSLDDVRLRMDSVADLRHPALWLGESGVADPRRIAVFGRSYGGFMVLAAVTTYPEVWAAGVDIVGIANWVPFVTSGIRRGFSWSAMTWGQRRRNAPITSVTRSSTGVAPWVARSAGGRGRLISTTTPRSRSTRLTLSRPDRLSNLRTTFTVATCSSSHHTEGPPRTSCIEPTV
jgi:dipeptidyl aminopeptidase/acylaminoacyl peptidase